LDYPGLIRQAGSGNADILLIPAQDWESVDPLHSHMAVFRAIENGVSVIKSTGAGLSIAVDPYGRLISATDYFNPGPKQMISCVPKKGIVTVYSRIGDAFAWLCISGLVIIVLSGYLSGRNKE
jgi:apolipoprotein N-acyltransferase